MRSAFLATLLATCFFACAAQHDDQYPTVDDFCRARAAAECQAAPRCGVTFNACAGARGDACVTEAARAIANRRRSYIAASAPACIDAVHRAYSIESQSQALDSAHVAAPLDDACGHVFCDASACDPGEAFEPLACAH